MRLDHCCVQGTGERTCEADVLHGESCKRLATPRNTKDKKHLQSTQHAILMSYLNQVYMQTKPWRHVNGTKTVRHEHYWSCQSPIRIWLVNYLHLHLLLEGIGSCTISELVEHSHETSWYRPRPAVDAAHQSVCI